MAVTPETILPFVPYAGHGGKTVFAPMVVPLDVSQTVQAGDIIIMDATADRAQVLNTDPTTARIIGIAYNGKVTGATVTDDDVIEIAPAQPGALFVASLVTSATADLTAPSYATHCAPTLYGTVEVLTFPVVDIADTTATRVKVVAFSRDQLRGQRFKSGTGGTTNPRVLVEFIHAETILGA